MVRVRYGAAACGAVLAVLAVTGCTTPDSGSPSPSTTTAPSPTAQGPEEKALDAYRNLWGEIVANSRTTDPDYSDLDRYAEGQALDLARHGLGAESEGNVVARGEPELSPEVVSLDEEASSAEIEDCLDSTGWLREDADTGELVEESPTAPIRRRIEATATSDGFVWRVSHLRIFEPGSC